MKGVMPPDGRDRLGGHKFNLQCLYSAWHDETYLAVAKVAG
jgi:hypothetical protein